MDNNQNNLSELNNDSSLLEQEKQIRAGQHNLRKKSTMLLLGGIILVVVLFALGIAWYTRISNTYSVKFNVADYDLAVNHNVDDYYVIEMYEYSEVTNKYMVPGSIGWMPLEISTAYSKVDVQYQIALENKMPDDIATHFRFYVLQDYDTVNSEWVYHYGEALESTDNGSEEALCIADYTSTSGSHRKFYLDPISETNLRSESVTDTITAGETKKLCIYWEWYLDAETAATAPTNTSGTLNGTRIGINWSSLTDTQKTDTSTAWNELDTDIGRYPDKYKEALTVFIHTSGAQVTPAEGVSHSGDDSGSGTGGGSGSGSGSGTGDGSGSGSGDGGGE